MNLFAARDQNKERQDIQGFTGHPIESAENVASCTLDAVKRGRYHVLTRPWKVSISQFSRGAIPPDTIWESLLETATYLPGRLVRFLTYSKLEKLALTNATTNQETGAEQSGLLP